MNNKYLSTAIITVILLSATSYASDERNDSYKRKSSFEEMLELVPVKKERASLPGEDLLLPNQPFVPNKSTLKAVISQRRGKNVLNPSGSETNCLDCSIAFLHYINSGRIVPAGDNPNTKPNILLASQGASIIDSDRAENLCIMNDRPDVIILEGDKAYVFTDVDRRAQVLLKACGMLHMDLNNNQSNPLIKPEPLPTLHEILSAVPLVNGKAVGCIYLEFLPEVQHKLSADNGFTGHFQNFYIYIKEDGHKEILIVDAQDGDIITLKEFLNKNRMKSKPNETLYYKNRMYVWWDKNAVLANSIKAEPSSRVNDEDILTLSHLSEDSSSEKAQPDSGKRPRSPFIAAESPDFEGTKKQATIPPKDKEEADQPAAIEILANAPDAPMTLQAATQLVNLQRTIITLKGGLATIEDRITLAEYTYQMAMLEEDPGKRDYNLLTAAQNVAEFVRLNCCNNRIRALLSLIWCQGRQFDGIPEIYPLLVEKSTSYRNNIELDTISIFNIHLQLCELAPSNSLRLEHLKSLNHYLSFNEKSLIVQLCDKDVFKNLTNMLIWLRKMSLDSHYNHCKSLFYASEYGHARAIWLNMYSRLKPTEFAHEASKIRLESYLSQANMVKLYTQYLADIQSKVQQPSIEIMRETYCLFIFNYNHFASFSSQSSITMTKFLKATGLNLIDLVETRLSLLADNATAQDYYDLAEVHYLYSKALDNDGNEFLQQAQKAYAKFLDFFPSGRSPYEFDRLKDLSKKTIIPAAVEAKTEATVINAPQLPVVKKEDDLQRTTHPSAAEIKEALNALIKAKGSNTPEAKSNALETWNKFVQRIQHDNLVEQSIRDISNGHRVAAYLTDSLPEKIQQSRSCFETYEKLLKFGEQAYNPRYAVKALFELLRLQAIGGKDDLDTSRKILSHREKLIAKPDYEPDHDEILAYIASMAQKSKVENSPENVISLLQMASEHLADAVRRNMETKYLLNSYSILLRSLSSLIKLGNIRPESESDKQSKYIAAYYTFEKSFKLLSEQVSNRSPEKPPAVVQKDAGRQTQPVATPPIVQTEEKRVSPPASPPAVNPINLQGLTDHERVIEELRQAIEMYGQNGALTEFKKRYNRIDWAQISPDELLDYYVLAHDLVASTHSIGKVEYKQICQLADHCVTLMLLRLEKLQSKPSAEDYFRLASAYYYRYIYGPKAETKTFLERATTELAKARAHLGETAEPEHFKGLADAIKKRYSQSYYLG